MRRSRLRSKSALKRSAIKRKRPSTKHRANDEPEYRLYVRTFPCCACGAWPTEPAHTNLLGREGSGNGQKTDDRSCVPLCHAHHREKDAGMRTTTFWADYGIDIKAVITALNREYDGREIEFP